MSGVDLHIHTTASDGKLSPEAIVARAAGLGLAAIAAEVAFADKNAQKKTFVEVIHAVLHSLQGGCFTVKFHVKQSGKPLFPPPLACSLSGEQKGCFTVEFHVKRRGGCPTSHNPRPVVSSFRFLRKSN